jgi:hypothetical protein
MAQNLRAPAAVRFSRLSSAYCAPLAVLLWAAPAAPAQTLPDAPSFLLAHAEDGPGDLPKQSQGETPLRGMTASQPSLPPPAPCLVIQNTATGEKSSGPEGAGKQALAGCAENPLQLIVTKNTRPLSSHEKGILAVKDVVDPFNIFVIAVGAGLSVAANPNSAYGPGFKGWGKLTGYSFVEDATGEFIGTYAISSLTHEDPRYHRLPSATVKRRIAHALLHTVWSQHDNGRPMLNYETLVTYPASAEISNLYVPGIQTDASSTARRIAIGLATDPAGSLIAEFLPDVAKRIHIRVVFMQQILNQVALGAPAVM